MQKPLNTKAKIEFKDIFFFLKGYIAKLILLCLGRTFEIIHYETQWAQFQQETSKMF